MRKFLIPSIILSALLFAGMMADWGVLSVAVDARAASITYHGNKKSHIFHRPGCRYYDCKNCVVMFSSRQQALAAGFRPCKICKP